MRVQGTFEYILLLGGIIVLVLLIINHLLNTANTSASEISETVKSASERIKQRVNELLRGLQS